MITTVLLVLLAQSQAAPSDLTGLWTAALRFGPDVRGTLLVMRSADGWRADIAGYSVSFPSPGGSDGQVLSFALPDDQGSFRGRIVGREIHGHWIQPRTSYNGGRYATPVTLVPDGAGRWRGIVTPWDDRFTMYVPLTAAGPGTYTTYLRNPDRNLGRFFRISRVAQRGDTVQFIGNQGEGERVLTQGIYEEGGIWGVRLRGGAYDFARVADTTSSGFYPRGRPAPRYRYRRPLQLDDGWAVAAPAEVGMARRTTIATR
jgi:hypothetical protein